MDLSTADGLIGVLSQLLTDLSIPFFPTILMSASLPATSHIFAVGIKYQSVDFKVPLCPLS